MHDWIAELRETEEPSVLVTIASVRGSAPREVGAKMIVTAKESIGTIGGGQLEYQCTRVACELLKSDNASGDGKFLRRFALGANCGQCCGGVVEVMFEQLSRSDNPWLSALRELHDSRQAVVMATSTSNPDGKYLVTAETCTAYGEDPDCPHAIRSAARSILAGVDDAISVDDFLLEAIRPNRFNIAVFGAGHVGTATVDVLRRLDCNIRWVDSRRNIFPASLPKNVLAVESADPAREVLAMPPASWFLIMTHSHPVDQEICTQVLTREDFAYCGLIGSLSKRRRFERLMKRQGIRESVLGRLVCPIGAVGVPGRRPAEIAIAVAAEVLQVRDALSGEATATRSNGENIRAIRR